MAGLVAVASVEGWGGRVGGGEERGCGGAAGLAAAESAGRWGGGLGGGERGSW
ncbi:hypothetical protein M8542_18730 [Amycolatopsis sp. OK19-0408]|uniref:Uncharacterized protein n=1 Tax=Amycolatopsis iheyensis TaxID=2945988 RepID=A0A9X2SK87_9PSEU|nr:hypothetical protein [Amycolatopsis iheyensis]MCR6484868.1 hypothetical protein [Amycolatopsis iheyensis]